MANPGADPIARPAYQRLLVLRACAIGAQLGVLLVATTVLGLEVPVAASAAVIAAQGLTVLVALAWRPAAGVPDTLYAAHLGVDLTGLTALFALNGGYANPFAFSYLVPLALAATMLRPRLVWALAGLALAGYACVCVWYRPMGHYHGPLGDSFDLHLAGMVAGYVVSAALIVGFVLPAAQAQRARARELAQVRARAARDADVVALGALLAGSAHALATPLASALLLADELAETGPDGAAMWRGAAGITTGGAAGPGGTGGPGVAAPIGEPRDVFLPDPDDAIAMPGVTEPGRTGAARSPAGVGVTPTAGQASAPGASWAPSSPATDPRVHALRDQLRECQRSLRRALAAAADPAAARVNVPAGDYLHALAQRLRTQRPECVLLARWPAQAGPRLDLDDRADQALLSVLHNAADVAPVVWLWASWDRAWLTVHVRDRGPGLPAPPRARHTTKAHGHGLGLFLAGAVVEGLGGSLTLHHPRGGGTRACVRLPLAGTARA